jgi:uncharacterized membrane protein YcaP (DUF421 family)
MLMIFFRAMVLYAVVVVFIRLMGKRQIGQLQPFELVITLMVADLVATPMQDIGVPIIEGLIPMFALFAVHNIISVLSVKFALLRKLFCGKPSVLISGGLIDETELRKLNISLSELLEGLRNNGVAEVSDIYRAMLETNGSMSIILRKQAQPANAGDAGAPVGPDTLQMTVIADGKLDHRNLKVLKVSEQALLKAIRGMGIGNIRDVFVALCDEMGTLYVQTRGASAVQKGTVEVTP